MSSLNCQGKLFEVRYPMVMGVINLTPDSYYKGSRFQADKALLEQMSQLLDGGAGIIEFGACSTRPGSEAPAPDEEKKRLFPALELARKAFPEILISLDTWRASIAYEAVKTFNVNIINDISAGRFDAAMLETVAECKVPFVLMHMQGTPADMQVNPSYEDITGEIIQFFTERKDACLKLGIHDLIIDPGFGFGKTLEQNYILLGRLSDFNCFDMPVMVGLSRKSMVYKVLGTSQDSALNGTTVLHTLALQQGARILRVHDAKEASEAIHLLDFFYTSTGINSFGWKDGSDIFH